jgi:ATP-dependent DNA ligase
MRAAGAADLPPARGGRELIYQPKWDGFRALAWTGPDRVALQSRHGRDLTRYFPKVQESLADHLPSGLLLDGELIVWDDARGRISFGHLQQRLTAGRRRQRPDRSGDQGGLVRARRLAGQPAQ